jgi:hypothetical protein
MTLQKRTNSEDALRVTRMHLKYRLIESSKLDPEYLYYG